MSTSYRTTPTSTKGMPGGIPYIIGNEAAERFSFYGMKAVLAVFMAQYLHLMGNTPGVAMSEPEAVEKVHLFTAAVYITPFLGALVSDILWGKYQTIIRLSIVYCIGHATLAMMGLVGDAGHWLFAGLFLISVGSGGIKPCVSAHVGDQFGKKNAHLLEKVYNMFYFSINLGSFISTMLTPWLLEWYGPHWAFGVPGVLMALATLMFWLGRKKFIHIPPKGKGFVRETFSGVGLRALGKLGIIYAFVALFWALFDQTASSWIFQAQDMDRNFLGREWLPSQIQALNPAMVMILIPLFTFFIYPAINRVFPLTPLRKISIGLFVTAVSFAVIAWAQVIIDNGGRPGIIWQFVAFLLITSAEVMVSIVCLEFSYTQAPKTMKSMIMALFLASVTLGNVFTAGVNAFIQIPDPTEETTAQVEDDSPEPTEILTRTHSGFDGKADTADDIVLTYQGEKLVKTEFPGYAEFVTARDRLLAAAEGKETIPSKEEADKLIAGLADPFGQVIAYTVLNSRRALVSTPGADKTPDTKWDMGFEIEFPEPTKTDESNAEEESDSGEKRKTWLDKRQEELAATDSGVEILEPDNAFVGGQSKLRGAAYFWFFTWVMFGTAVVFVVVAKLYKPRTYLHDDEDAEQLEAEAEAEAIAQ